MCNSKELLYTHVGRKIKEIRKKHNMNQDDFGKLLDCSRVIVSHMENGKQQCPIDRIYKMSEIFDVSPLYFLPGVSGFYNKDIKVGDIVELKSGGPEMTVSEINASTVRCHWFKEGKVFNDFFFRNCIKKKQ